MSCLVKICHVLFHIRCTSFWQNQSVMCAVPLPLAQWCACTWVTANRPPLPAVRLVWSICGNAEALLEKHSGTLVCVCVCAGLFSRLMSGYSSVTVQDTISVMVPTLRLLWRARLCVCVHLRLILLTPLSLLDCSPDPNMNYRQLPNGNLTKKKRERGVN